MTFAAVDPARRAIAPLLAVALGGFISVSCTDDGPVPVNNNGTSDDDGSNEIMCTPGEELGCMCTDGRAGFQLCAPNGQELGRCQCTDPDPDDGGTSESGEEESSGGSSDDGGGLCGNGTIDEGEQCDDGNRRGNDTCSDTCIEECGQQWETIVGERDTASFGNDAAVGSDGSVAVVGTQQGRDNNDIWVARYDADGSELWSTSVDLGGNDSASSVAMDDSGNIVVVGTVSGDNAQDIWVQAYDADGNELWGDRHDGATNGADFGTSVAYDGDGNAIVAGTVRDGEGDTDLWIRKYGTDGSETWTETYTGPGNGEFSTDQSAEVAVDADGDIYAQVEVYVEFDERDLHLVKFDASGGDPLWDVAPFMGGIADEQRGAGVAVTPSGDVIMAINDDVVSSAWRFWLASYTPDGTEQWLIEGEEAGLGDRHQVDTLGIADNGQIGLVLSEDEQLEGLRTKVATLQADGSMACSNAVGLRLGTISAGGGGIGPDGRIVATGLTTVNGVMQQRWLSGFRGAADPR